MIHRRVRYISTLMTLIVFVAGCGPVSTPSYATPTVEAIVPEVEPTPIPTREPHLPGELFEYFAQSGDTLPALASHFNTSVNEILAANPDLPSSITTIPPDYPLQIPAYYVPLTGSAFHILPDSEVIYGPSAVDFDVFKEIDRRSGFLKDLSAFAYKRQRQAWQVVEVIAKNYSLNPRVLLAMLEHQTQALTKPVPEGNQADYPMGVEQVGYKGLNLQLIWVAERLNDGYYGWRTGTLEEIELADGLLVRPDPWQNAGTVAIHLVFAGIHGKQEFDQAVSPDGFYQTYKELWGDPFEAEIVLIPGNLQQPELALPFMPNHIWNFSSGPHYSWGTSLPLGALDFAPPAMEGECAFSAEWITAPVDGVIARSDEAIVVLDLDGDGDERTGWVLFFLHVGTDGRIEDGVQVELGDLLGHPSCEGGRATGTNFHVARRYNGEWVPAGGPLAFVLDGWVTAYGEEPRQGTLTKGSKVVPASEDPTAANRIFYELP